MPLLADNAPVSDADMMQTFLPAFEAVVVDSQIRGIMCAYNSVNVSRAVAAGI